jgi:putative transcriptional regulator
MGRRPKSEEDAVISQIEHYRVLAGLSRQELADAVGVHYQTIGYIERGEYSPSLVLALKFAKALNASVEDIFQLGENK